MALGMGDLITVVEYDPRWPALYEEEKARITGAIGSVTVAIEHVGSTAVPGLGAKPIIDIMVGIREFALGVSCVEPLASLGYEHRPDDNIPGRLFFRRFDNKVRTHNLHVTEMGSDFWERHLLFRDYLKAHSEEARRYHELKEALAATYRSDRAGYADAKTGFIESALSKARALKAAG